MNLHTTMTIKSYVKMVIELMGIGSGEREKERFVELFRTLPSRTLDRL